MILLFNLIKPDLQMGVRVKSQSLYFSDPNLELIRLSGVEAQNHSFVTDLGEFLSREGADWWQALES